MTYSQKSTLPLADVGVLPADDKDSSGFGEGERALKPRLYQYVVLYQRERNYPTIH